METVSFVARKSSLDLNASRRGKIVKKNFCNLCRPFYYFVSVYDYVRLNENQILTFYGWVEESRKLRAYLYYDCYDLL